MQIKIQISGIILVDVWYKLSQISFIDNWRPISLGEFTPRKDSINQVARISVLCLYKVLFILDLNLP